MPASARDVPARLWKPTSTRVCALRLVLLDDVGEHAVAGRQFAGGSTTCSSSCSSRTIVSSSSAAGLRPMITSPQP